MYNPLAMNGASNSPGGPYKYEHHDNRGMPKFSQNDIVIIIVNFINYLVSIDTRNDCITLDLNSALQRENGISVNAIEYYEDLYCTLFVDNTTFSVTIGSDMKYTPSEMLLSDLLQNTQDLDSECWQKYFKAVVDLLIHYKDISSIT